MFRAAGSGNPRPAPALPLSAPASSWAVVRLVVARFGLLFAFACSPAPDSGRDADAELPQSPSPEATTALVERFQSILDSAWSRAQATDENFPGATAAFILPDGRVFGFATGYSDVDDGTAMTKDLRMPSGSIGKTYVAAVALQLALNGALDLDAPVSTWLGDDKWSGDDMGPEGDRGDMGPDTRPGDAAGNDEPWFARVPNHADLTLRNLLDHTAGMIQPYFEDPGFAERLGEVFRSPRGYMPAREFVVESVADHEPLFPAGEGFHYSDVHYVIAGLAMEAATGRSYYEMLNDFFLEPLALDHTLPADRPDLPGLAQGYAHASSRLFGTPLEVVAGGALVVHPMQEWTGGGVVNNPQALVRWAKLLYEGDAIQGDDLPDLLTIGFPPDGTQPHIGYGLGVSVAESEHGLTYGHGGFFPGYNSLVTYYRDHGIAVAIQINSDEAQGMQRHLEWLAEIVVEAVSASGAAANIVVGPDYLVSRDGDRPHVEVMAAANPLNAHNLVAGAITFTRPGGGPATKAYVSHDGGTVWHDVTFPEQPPWAEPIRKLPSPPRARPSSPPWPRTPTRPDARAHSCTAIVRRLGKASRPGSHDLATGGADYALEYGAARVEM